VLYSLCVVSFIVCVALCVDLFERCVILCDVYFCVLCLIVVPLPPGKTPFAVQISNNEIIMNPVPGIRGSAIHCLNSLCSRCPTVAKFQGVVLGVRTQNTEQPQTHVRSGCCRFLGLNIRGLNLAAAKCTSVQASRLLL
jgi:hypothetical protein